MKNHETLLLETALGSAKFHSFDIGTGSNLYGVYSGQLYHLIKEIKHPTDTTPEEQFKPILLNFILGEGILKVHHVKGKDYFCATEEQWTKAGVVFSK